MPALFIHFCHRAVIVKYRLTLSVHSAVTCSRARALNLTTVILIIAIPSTPTTGSWYQNSYVWYVVSLLYMYYPFHLYDTSIPFCTSVASSIRISPVLTKLFSHSIIVQVYRALILHLIAAPNSRCVHSQCECMNMQCTAMLAVVWLLVCCMGGEEGRLSYSLSCHNTLCTCCACVHSKTIHYRWAGVYALQGLLFEWGGYMYLCACSGRCVYSYLLPTRPRFYVHVPGLT